MLSAVGRVNIPSRAIPSGTYRIMQLEGLATEHHMRISFANRYHRSHTVMTELRRLSFGGAT
jgi:hypothetical protein